MGQRIGALWRKKGDDGVERITGNINSESGVNIPAGVTVGLAIVKNDKKTGDASTDKQPDFYVEVFTKTEGR